MENKTENKKGMDINVWLPILNDLNIDPSKHYEVLDYISRHTQIEDSIFGQLRHSSKTTLPLALRVLSKLDLNMVEMIDYHSSSIHVDISFDALEELPIPIATDHIASAFIDETVRLINNLIDEKGKIKIYCLFYSLNEINNKYTYIHRVST